MKARRHILFIGTDAGTIGYLSDLSAEDNLALTLLKKGEDPIDLAYRLLPDLIVIDLDHFDLDSVEICQSIKSNYDTKGIIVIVVSGRNKSSEAIESLQMGADYHISKPINEKIFISQIRAIVRLLNGNTGMDTGRIIIDDLEIRPEQYRVLVDGEDIHLTLTEFNILLMMAKRPGWVFSRSTILDIISPEYKDTSERSVDVHIANLRRRLGQFGKRVETVRGKGYRLL